MEPTVGALASPLGDTDAWRCLRTTAFSLLLIVASNCISISWNSPKWWSVLQLPTIHKPITWDHFCKIITEVVESKSSHGFIVSNC